MCAFLWTPPIAALGDQMLSWMHHWSDQVLVFLNFAILLFLIFQLKMAEVSKLMIISKQRESEAVSCYDDHHLLQSYRDQVLVCRNC